MSRFKCNHNKFFNYRVNPASFNMLPFQHIYLSAFQVSAVRSNFNLTLYSDISWKLIQFSQRQEKDKLARKSALCLILFVVQLSAVFSWYWKQSGSPPIASSMWAALNSVRLRASVRMATDSALISRVFDTGFSLVMRWRQEQRYITWSPAFFVTLAILLTRGRTTPWPLLVFFIWSKTHKDGNYTEAKSVCQEPNILLKLQRGLVNCHPTECQQRFQWNGEG